MIKAIAAPVTEQCCVSATYLFGSYARSEATPASDLDFRIERGRICLLRQPFAGGGGDAGLLGCALIHKRRFPQNASHVNQ